MRKTIGGPERYKGLPMERQMDKAYAAELRLDAEGSMIFEDDEDVDEDLRWIINPATNIRTDRMELMGQKLMESEHNLVLKTMAEKEQKSADASGIEGEQESHETQGK